MGGCSAINCNNHSNKNNRMFKFPKDPERRKVWIINCRRKDWEPSASAQLCSDHFEECQFEQNRQDGWKKLKQNAIPTLFQVPNPPPMLSDKRKKGVGRPKPDSLLASHGDISEKENDQQSNDELKKKIALLEKENESLKNAIKEKDKVLASFLSEEQIQSLYVERKSIAHWSNEAIIKALKIRFALGKDGFNFLRGTRYPLPSYSTINKRIQNIKFNFGCLFMLFDLLKTKVEVMDEADRNCCLSLDEMEIANFQDFDVSAKSFVGNITLGNPGVANHYLVILLRGIKSQWKQIVGHELTGRFTHGPAMKKVIYEIVNAAKSIGLKVRASTSDMGASNKAMWSSLGVSVTKTERKTCYQINEDNVNIHAIADVPHLMKNVRNAFLSRPIILPDAVRQEHDLPCRLVSSEYLKQLWLSEVDSDNSLRFLHHLHRNHLFPSHFNKMNVATAKQLLSVPTAVALETAVSLEKVHKDALATAWWIRLMAQWFELMTARERKRGITARNKDEKFEFLNYFINVVQETQFGNGWKPVQTGMILSTKNVINLSTELFSEGFDFFLPSRLTQDALENVFSQIRRRSAAKPTALQAKTALRLVTISQFISDVKHTNYAKESDFHLLDANVLNQSRQSEAQNISDNIPLLDTTSSGHTASSSQTVSSIAAEENNIYYIAGATLNAILKRKNICQSCLDAVKLCKDIDEPDVQRHKTLYTEYSDMGGLKKPDSGLFRICREAEKTFKENKDNLLLHQQSIDDNFIQNIVNNCENINLPTCCNVKKMIIDHYLIVRCKGLKNFLATKRAQEACFSSASANKK